MTTKNRFFSDFKVRNRTGMGTGTGIGTWLERERIGTRKERNGTVENENGRETIQERKK